MTCGPATCFLSEWTNMRFATLCSGIDGFGVGFERAGMECVYQCEVDPACQKVLNYRWPGIPKGTDVNDEAVANELIRLRPDIVAFGSPCQDLSVAGRRAGLAGQRSGVFFRCVELCYLCETPWVVFENVPGIFSSHKGRDFAAVLEAFTGVGFSVPREGWKDTGVAIGPLYSVAWAVLDAQWFGVPQRRRRLFLVASLGDRSGPYKVLSVAESLPWDSPPSREAGQVAAACFTPGAHPGSHNGQDDHKDGRLIAATLNSGSNNGGFRSEPGEHIIPVQNATRGKEQNGLGIGGDVMFTLDQASQHAIAFHENQRGEITTSETAGALNVGGGKPGQGYPAVAFQPKYYADRELQGGKPSETAPTLTSAQAERSDGEIAVAYQCNDLNDVDKTEPLAIAESGKRHGVSSRPSKEGTGISKPGDPMFTIGADSRHAVAYQCHGSNVGPMGTLRQGNGNESGGVPFIADDYHAGTFEQSDQARPLTTSPDRSRAVPVVVESTEPFTFQTRIARNGRGQPDEVAPALTGSEAGDTCDSRPCVSAGMAVRRLTPKECERLQGFQDDWTRYGVNGEELSDSVRYRMCGNAVAVPVVQWIGSMIVAVQSSERVEKHDRIA